MAEAPASAAAAAFEVSVTTEVMPARDARHGTPHPVTERVFTFTLPQGTAVVDQTDYGHAGRFNPVHLRKIPSALQPKTPQVLAAAEALAALL